MLGSILLIALVAVCFAIMFGFTAWAKKAFWWIVAIAVVGPLLLAVLVCWLQSLGGGQARASTGKLLIFGLIGLFLFGWLRHLWRKLTAPKPKENPVPPAPKQRIDLPTRREGNGHE